MSQSLFNELLNGHLFILMLYMSMVFARFIYAERNASYQDLRPAFAMLVLVLGEAMVRGTFWWTRHQINLGYPEPYYHIPVLIGAGVQLAGIIWVIRVFSPTECGPNSWWWAVVLAVVWSWGWLLHPFI